MATRPLPASQTSSGCCLKLSQPTANKCACALAIIAVIGALAVGGMGVAGYLQAGALSSLSQAQAIAMMVGGFGGGTLLLAAGICMRNCSPRPLQPLSGNLGQQGPHTQPQYQGPFSAQARPVAQPTEAPLQLPPSKPRIYAEEIWRLLFQSVEIRDTGGNIVRNCTVPKSIMDVLDEPCPFSSDSKVKIRDTHTLMLIPARVDGKKLCLNTLKDVEAYKGGVTHKWYGTLTQEEQGEFEPGASYWMLIKNEPVNASTDIESLQYQRPQLYEAVAYSLLTYAHTATRPFCQLFTQVAAQISVDKDRRHVCVGSPYLNTLVVASPHSGEFTNKQFPNLQSAGIAPRRSFDLDGTPCSW